MVEINLYNEGETLNEPFDVHLDYSGFGLFRRLSSLLLGRFYIFDQKKCVLVIAIGCLLEADEVGIIHRLSLEMSDRVAASSERNASIFGLGRVSAAQVVRAIEKQAEGLLGGIEFDQTLSRRDRGK